jgi:hypothetical protein
MRRWRRSCGAALFHLRENKELELVFILYRIPPSLFPTVASILFFSLHGGSMEFPEPPLRGCISAQLCAHFFIICTFSPLRTIINDASRKITSQISSFRTFPRSDVFRKICEASLELPDFRELERGLTPNLGSSVARSNFFVHTVARKNCQIYYVPTYRKFKYCTAKISSKYLIVFFNYSVLPKYIFTHC